MESTTFDIARLDRALSCPMWAPAADYPMAARIVIYECWATLLFKYLPDPSAVSLLIDRDGMACRSIYSTPGDFDNDELDQDAEPELRNPLLLETLIADEVQRFTNTLEGSRFGFATLRSDGPRVRDDITDELHPATEAKPMCGIWLDNEFDRLTRWIQSLRIVEGCERNKHWPPGFIKTPDDLIAYSVSNSGVGWLNPGSDPKQLRRSALAAIAAHFSRTLRSRNNEDFVRYRVSDFLETWNELFDQGTFRLGVEHKKVMGATDGVDCRRVVYDVDPSGMQFHCFPVATFPPVKGTFMESELDL
jgi:hypothetical protein